MLKISVIIIVLFSAVGIASGQSNPPDSVLVAFWNMENFFDPFVDSTRAYNAFTEAGEQHWTASRFYRKRNNIYKAILAFSEGLPIGIFGVCEVENDYVLNALFGQTPLKRFNYRWVHYEGPDRRGIDPAIVYSKDLFQLIASEAIPYHNPENGKAVSRDILYAKFYDYRHDTLHCFVNHWPSKYSGELETVEARNAAARILRRKVDSLFDASLSHDGASTLDPPKILVMGDFNDTPDAPCIREVLRAGTWTDTVDDKALVNLFAENGNLGFKGTLKYRESWMVFDQIIVSKSLINSKSLHCISSDARIVHEDFLLEKDKTYQGQKLNRTYVGQRHHGGFSDHLPVVLLLRY